MMRRHTVTLGQLVQALQDSARSDEEVVAVITHLLTTRRVSLDATGRRSACPQSAAPLSRRLEGAPMTQLHPHARVNWRLVRVGEETVAVYGNDYLGWSIDWGDLGSAGSVSSRYRTLEELVFALVNWSVADEGNA